MKLNELIEKYKRYEGKWNSKTGELARQIFLEDLKQLDEPQPVKVPQCVADWYLLHYHDFNNSIVNLCIRLEDSIDNNDFLKWISNTKDFIKILVNIHQFGYEVEEEKQYLVKIKATKHYLVKDGNGKIFFSLAFKGYFTKKELEEADFGWVFDCPGIEIEEVEHEE